MPTNTEDKSVPSFTTVKPAMQSSPTKEMPVVDKPVVNSFLPIANANDQPKPQASFVQVESEKPKLPILPQFIEKKSAIEDKLVVLGPVSTIEVGPHFALKNMYTGELIVRKDNQVETLEDLRNIEAVYKDRSSLIHPNLSPILDYKTLEVLKIPLPNYETKAYYSFQKNNLRYVKELRLESKVEFREREISLIGHNLVNWFLIRFLYWAIFKVIKSLIAMSGQVWFSLNLRVSTILRRKQSACYSTV